MANITINGEVVATLTENAKDIGNSEYLKILIGGKPYYARLATDTSKLFVYKENKKQYVQKDPIFFETFRYEQKGKRFEQRFNLWLPKGTYLITIKASNSQTKSLTMKEGKDVLVLFEANVDSEGDIEYRLVITNNGLTLLQSNETSLYGGAQFIISRQRY